MVKVHMSEDDALSDDDIVIFSEGGACSIQPGEVESVSGSFDMDGRSMGDYFLFAKFDAADQLNEPDETDNVSAPVSFEHIGSVQEGTDDADNLQGTALKDYLWGKQGSKGVSATTDIEEKWRWVVVY